MESRKQPPAKRPTDDDRGARVFALAMALTVVLGALALGLAAALR